MAQKNNRESNQNRRMKTKPSTRVWVVVEVKSGVPVLAEAFGDENIAKRRQRKLRGQMRKDYDEVGLFEAAVAH